MSRTTKDSLIERFDEGLKKIEKGKFEEGLTYIRWTLGSAWFLDHDPDALMADLTFFIAEPRLKKLKDNKEFTKKFLGTLNNLRKSYFLEKNSAEIYNSLKEMIRCLMEHIPTLEE